MASKAPTGSSKNVSGGSGDPSKPKQVAFSPKRKSTGTSRKYPWLDGPSTSFAGRQHPRQKALDQKELFKRLNEGVEDGDEEMDVADAVLELQPGLSCSHVTVAEAVKRRKRAKLNEDVEDRNRIDYRDAQMGVAVTVMVEPQPVPSGSHETVAEAVKRRKRTTVVEKSKSKEEKLSSNTDVELYRTDFSYRLNLKPFACKCEERLSIPPRDKPTRCVALDHIDDLVVNCMLPLGDQPVYSRPSTAIPFGFLCEWHLRRLRNHECCPRCGQFCTQGQFVACGESGEGKFVHMFHSVCALQGAHHPQMQDANESGHIEDDLTLCPHCLVVGPAQFIKVELRSSEKLIFHPMSRRSLPSDVVGPFRAISFVSVKVDRRGSETVVPYRLTLSTVDVEHPFDAVEREFLAVCRPQWRRNTRLCADITRGHEVTPIQCVNEIDDAPAPEDFVYITENMVQAGIRFDRRDETLSCRCEGVCSLKSCSCLIVSFGCWYKSDGCLVDNFDYVKPPYVYECGPLCCCNAKLGLGCKNRVVQNGIIFQLELFRAENRGWGVRTLESIPKGAFVCEYIGELIGDLDAEMRAEDSYLFDLDPRDSDTNCIDARHFGNIARFINHRCDPNLSVVKVLYDHQDVRFPHIALFANEDISVGSELGYDYGDKFWVIKSKNFLCGCGSEKCKYEAGTIEKTLKDYRKRIGD